MLRGTAAMGVMKASVDNDSTLRGALWGMASDKGGRQECGQADEHKVQGVDPRGWVLAAGDSTHGGGTAHVGGTDVSVNNVATVRGTLRGMASGKGVGTRASTACS